MFILVCPYLVEKRSAQKEACEHIVQGAEVGHTHPLFTNTLPSCPPYGLGGIKGNSFLFRTSFDNPFLLFLYKIV